MSAPRRVVVHDMAIGHGDFWRIIPDVLGSPVPASGDTLRHETGGRVAVFRLGPPGSRSIGSLTMPRTRVEIVLDGFTEAEAEAFLARFDLHFRRGGG